MSSNLDRPRTNALDGRERSLPHPLPWESVRTVRSRLKSLWRGWFDHASSDASDEDDFEEDVIDDVEEEIEEEIEEEVEETEEEEEEEEEEEGTTFVFISAEMLQAMLDGRLGGNSDLSSAADFLYMKWLEQNLRECMGMKGSSSGRCVLRRVPRDVDARKGLATIHRLCDGSIVVSRRECASEPVEIDPACAALERSGVMRIYRGDPLGNDFEEYPCTCLSSDDMHRWRIDGASNADAAASLEEALVDDDAMVEFMLRDSASDAGDGVWLIGICSESARALWLHAPATVGGPGGEVVQAPVASCSPGWLDICVEDEFVAKEIQEVVDRFEGAFRNLKDYPRPAIDAAGAWFVLRR